VLEHGTVTMYFTGISRSLTHELIRHRHFSYSQLSQRYVPSATPPWSSRTSSPRTGTACQVRRGERRRSAGYTELLEGLEKKFADVEQATLRRKQARQAARAVLPRTPPRLASSSRELPGLAALRRDARLRARRRRDPRLGHRLPARAAAGGPNVFADFRSTFATRGEDATACPSGRR